MVSEISYKTFTGAKPLCIIFDKVHGFFRVYDGTTYLVLFGPNFVILIKSVFSKNQNHYHNNTFLEKGTFQLPQDNDNNLNFCINYKCYILKKMLFLKKLMLIRKANQRSHYCYISYKWFKIQPDFCNRCQDILMITVNLINITLLKIMVLIAAVLIMELGNLLQIVDLKIKMVFDE